LKRTASTASISFSKYEKRGVYSTLRCKSLSW
jgi:hypothetical protein